MPFHVRGDRPKDQLMPFSDMTVGEAIQTARMWWDVKGRDLMKHNRNRSTDGFKDDGEILEKSGILTGSLFDDLTREDQLKITREWYLSWLEGEKGIPRERFDNHTILMSGEVVNPELPGDFMEQFGKFLEGN